MAGECVWSVLREQQISGGLNCCQVHRYWLYTTVHKDSQSPSSRLPLYTTPEPAIELLWSAVNIASVSISLFTAFIHGSVFEFRGIAWYEWESILMTAEKHRSVSFLCGTVRKGIQPAPLCWTLTGFRSWKFLLQLYSFTPDWHTFKKGLYIFVTP